jgi:hypothetical protein
MRLQAFCFAIASALLVSSCTTFSLSKSETIVQQNDPSSEGRFRRGVLDFQRQYSEAGWLREAESAGRVQAFLSIINKGWSHKKEREEAEKAPAKDAVSLYLARVDAQENDDPLPPQGFIMRDLEHAFIAMQTLNSLAAPLLDHYRPKESRIDVMELERALLSARKAQSLFAGAVERINPTLELNLRADMAAQLARNNEEITRMKALADALNALRLSARPLS